MREWCLLWVEYDVAHMTQPSYLITEKLYSLLKLNTHNYDERLGEMSKSAFFSCSRSELAEQHEQLVLK